MTIDMKDAAAVTKRLIELRERANNLVLQMLEARPEIGNTACQDAKRLTDAMDVALADDPFGKELVAHMGLHVLLPLKEVASDLASHVCVLALHNHAVGRLFMEMMTEVFDKRLEIAEVVLNASNQ